MNRSDFWLALDEMVSGHGVTLDRPKGSPHPRYPPVVYPLDYGYVNHTRSGDGDGVDVWVGSLPAKLVSGVICTVDLDKRDVELKILLGCTPQEAQMALVTHNLGAQSAILVERTNPV